MSVPVFGFYRLRFVFPFIIAGFLSLFVITPVQPSVSSPDSNYPPDLNSDIPWASSGTSTAAHVQEAFTNARVEENSQLVTSIPSLTLPDQSTWDTMESTLSAVGEGGALSYADDQVNALSGHSSTDFWRFKPEHTVYLRPTEPPFTEYVYKQVDVGAGATGAAIATCPSTSIVVGGGYAANPDVTFYTQYKYENGWRGDARNYSVSSKQITVYAVCLHNVCGVSVTQVHGQVNVPSGTRKRAVATCPAGSIATGGGFHAYPDGSLRVYNSSKSDSGEGWQSWAHNLSGSTKTHHAYATCLSGSGGTTARILQSISAPPSTTAYAVPKCGSGSLVTCGGFAAQDDLLIYSNSGPYSGDEWRVYVKNTHSSDDRTLFGYAICLSLLGNKAPTDISLSNSSVAENQPVNTAVGDFSTTDPDTGNTFTYTLMAGTGDTDNASFNISGDSLRTSEVFDYETKNSYSIRVRSADWNCLYFEKVFTITVIDEVAKSNYLPLIFK
jgi:guanyl-specific ribonuclease Sa